jgi:hypothetical protein
MYDTSWWSQIDNNNSKLRTYKHFKSSPSLENYLLEISDVQKRKEFTKLRISSHQLQIELGRYTKPRKTPVENRICKLCNSQEVENEEHFVMSCTLYENARTTLFDHLNSFTSFGSLRKPAQWRYGNYKIKSDFVNDCIVLRENYLNLPRP